MNQAIMAEHSPTSNLLSISDKEFELMRKLIYDRFGINLSPEKKSLVVARLQKVLRAEGLPSFKKYYEQLTSSRNSQSLSKLIDNISTNHTYFFRESAHFDYFSEHAIPSVLDMLRKENSRDIRIWSAGCSSGEEPYMLLMLMHEVLGSGYASFDAGILATDISDRILNIAKKGIYSTEKMTMIPENLRKKYFNRIDTEHMQVKDHLRKEVLFRRFNLMNEVFPFKQQFHIIFCRNVMIYFDQETRDQLVNKFCKQTVKGGYLFIGHSETIGRAQQFYRYLIPAGYQKL